MDAIHLTPPSQTRKFKGLACLVGALAGGVLLGCDATLTPPTVAKQPPAMEKPLEPPIDRAQRNGQPHKNSTDALTSLNETFRALYKKSRAAELARTSPILLAAGDKLILVRQGQFTESPDVPVQYHQLKALAHLPLAVDVVLLGTAPGSLTEGTQKDLVRLREHTLAIRDELPKYGFTPTQLARQQEIVQNTLDFLDQLAKTQQHDQTQRIAFCRKQRPLLMQNVAEATKVRIDSYVEIAESWKTELEADEWARLRVVVLGAALPRKDNLAVQVFAKLLGVPGEGERLVYTESIFEPAPALDSLGTHIIDRSIAVDFFDDPDRMNRDLLGDAAAEYLKTLSLPE